MPLPRPFDEQPDASAASSGSSFQTVSPATPSDSRLVARTRTRPHEVAALRRARRMRRRRARSCRARAARRGRAGRRGARRWRSRRAGVWIPSARAVSAGTSACRWRRRGRRARHLRAAAPTSRCARASATRVLPTPPGPVSVTRRVLRSVSPIASRSRTRPTSDVSAMGRLCSVEPVGSRGPAAVAMSRAGRRYALSPTRAPVSGSKKWSLAVSTWIARGFRSVAADVRSSARRRRRPRRARARRPGGPPRPPRSRRRGPRRPRASSPARRRR